MYTGPGYVGPPSLFNVGMLAVIVVLGVYASIAGSLPWWLPAFLIATFVGYVALYLHRRRTKRANGD